MTQPKICERCGKTHPTPWIHKGDCPLCFGAADARTLRDRGMCKTCWARVMTPTPESEQAAAAWVEHSWSKKDGVLDV